jgi:ferritin-like metal-binding protein YciE
MRTLEELTAWRGRDALDADGTPLGTIAQVYVSATTGEPQWLALDLDSEAEYVLVPVAGAEPTGSAIRIAQLADTIRSAPRLAKDAELTPDDEQVLRTHYGLDTRRLRPPVERPGPGALADPATRSAIVTALRNVLALERSGLRRLQKLAETVKDPEALHDVVLHRNHTTGHCEAVAARLDELEPEPWTWRDAIPFGVIRRARDGLERPSGDETDALEYAEAFERGEAARYRDLERLARHAGDGRTAALAARHRADEEAMAVRLAGDRARLLASRPVHA